MEQGTGWGVWLIVALLLGALGLFLGSLCLKCWRTHRYTPIDNDGEMFA